jgi:mRNA-degrading endonuclease RelE of RelBE toxin-antitoxin system
MTYTVRILRRAQKKLAAINEIDIAMKLVTVLHVGHRSDIY